jgi:DNA-binding NarL/FixJ family response regulator
MTRMRVLVADDLPAVLSAVAAQLQGTFEVVSLVDDGRAALDATLQLDPDLILLDISMPGMNGIEVAEELKNHPHRGKIVFLTTYEDPDILAACLAAGALGYVVKSFIDSDLIVAMTEALAGRSFVSRFSSSQ